MHMLLQAIDARRRRFCKRSRIAPGSLMSRRLMSRLSTQRLAKRTRHLPCWTRPWPSTPHFSFTPNGSRGLTHCVQILGSETYSSASDWQVNCHSWARCSQNHPPEWQLPSPRTEIEILLLAPLDTFL